MKKKLLIALIFLALFKTSLAQNSLVAKEENGKYGFNDALGKMIVPPKYDYAGNFEHGLAMVVLGKKYGYVDETGTLVIPLIYDDGVAAYDDLPSVKLNDKWGNIDKTGKVIIPFQYDRSLLFSEGLASVFINGKYGFVDKNNNLVIPAIYDDVYVFGDGKARVQLNGQWIVIDKPAPTNTTVYKKEETNLNPTKTISNNSTPEYTYKSKIKDGLSEVILNGKTGYIDESGKIIIPLVYDEGREVYDGFASVKLDGKWGSVDKTGKVVIPFQYDRDLLFSDGLASVFINGKYGFIDKNNKLVVPAIYDNVYVFSDGKARVELNGKWIVIDKPSPANTTVAKNDEPNVNPTKSNSSNSFADAINILVNDAEEDFKTIRGDKGEYSEDIYPHPKTLVEGCYDANVYDPEQAPFAYMAKIIETSDKDSALNKYNEFLNILISNKKKINALFIRNLIFDDASKFNRGQVAQIPIVSKTLDTKGEKTWIYVDVRISCTQNSNNKKYSVNLAITKESN